MPAFSDIDRFKCFDADEMHELMKQQNPRFRWAMDTVERVRGYSVKEWAERAELAIEASALHDNENDSQTEVLV